jgi:DNA repair exonuclease SbcCD nuclease subunit
MILHGVITIFLGTIVALMLTADVGDFKSATFAKSLKEKEFEIQKMAFISVEKDSVIKELQTAQNLLNAQKDSIESIYVSIANEKKLLINDLSKLKKQNLEYKNKEDKKLQNQTRINELNSRREQDIKDIAKTFNKMKSKELKPILSKHYDSDTIVKIYREMSVKKELILAMDKHPESVKFFSRVFGAKKPKKLVAK